MLHTSFLLSFVKHWLSLLSYSVTATLPSVTGKTVGTEKDDRVDLKLFVSAGANFNSRTGSLGIQNNTFDFWGVQVEEGAVVTPFEQKPYADELRACLRYYERLDVPISGGNDLLATCYSTAAPAIFPWKYTVEKRSSGIISYPTNGVARYISTASVASGLTLTTSVNKSTKGAVLATTTNQAVGSGWVDGFSVVCDAEL